MCLVVDRDALRHSIVDAVGAAVRAGVDWVQIRDRALGGARLFAFSLEVAGAARDAAKVTARPLRILVNRRIDVALAICADGVHLGFDALAPAEARALLGNDSLVGCSLHTASEITAAAEAGATYAHLAPIWDPKSKAATRPALGTGPLAAACARGLPILAQGGVTVERCAEAISAGAAGVAVTGAILHALDPGAAAAAFRRTLDESAARRQFER